MLPVTLNSNDHKYMKPVCLELKQPSALLLSNTTNSLLFYNTVNLIRRQHFGESSETYYKCLLNAVKAVRHFKNNPSITVKRCLCLFVFTVFQRHLQLAMF